MSKKIVPVFVLSVFVVLILVYGVFAITGAIGNARMVLRVDAGEKIEKYILVKNVNDVPVTIQLSADGDLKEYIDIKDKEFKLNAGEEKKAYFTITAKEGSTESRINVKFIPEEGNGVGLSSTIIVITNANETVGENEDNGNVDENISNKENNTTEGQKTGMDIITSKFTSLSGSGNGVALIILTSMTVIIFIIFIVLLILKNRMIKKNQEEIKEEKEVKEVKTKTKKSAKRSG